jgi:tetratricopeptide (TPR) repeat protein
MSGGPVLNENGELIAIHGQGDREGDGGSGDKTGRNLGIVIERFGIVASSMEIPDYFLKSISFAALPQGETLNAEDYFLLGQAQKIPENMPEAMDNYNKAISLDPKLAIAYASRGSLKFAIAYTFREESSNLEIDIQGAIADLNKAIALDPASNFAYYVRGRFKINLNDVPGAMADLNKAISLNPNSHSYPGSYSYYYRGVLKKDKLKDRKGAIKDFRKALELNKKNNPDGHPDRHYDSIIERLGELGVSTS